MATCVNLTDLRFQPGLSRQYAATFNTQPTLRLNLKFILLIVPTVQSCKLAV